MDKKEKEFLQNYDIKKYERPSVAADIAIFSIMENKEKENFRKLSQKALKILLIERAKHPYKDCYALPGGFCKKGEDVIDTARRELLEETGVEYAYMKPTGIYGKEGRDPRGWIVSNTFLALLDGNQYTLHAGSDAEDANWFSIHLEENPAEKEAKNEDRTVSKIYKMIFENLQKNISFSVEVKQVKKFCNYHESTEYEILDSGKLAFDHGKIILETLLILRNNMENNLKTAFDFMPETFTLTELQNVFELVLGKKLLKANFRRKILEYVIETDQVIEGAGHRPAKLFKRNVEAFYKL